MKLKNLILITLIVAAACNEISLPKFITEKRDTTIKKNNSFSDIFLDSIALEKYIQQQRLSDTIANQFRNFYNSRNYQYAWFFSDGLAEQAHNFWNMQSDYINYSGDSSIYNDYLQKIVDSATAKNDSIALPDSSRLHAELLFTQQFFQYAVQAFQGNKSLDPNNLQWFIPRKKIDMVSFLDSLVRNKGKNANEYEPTNRQYNLLKNYLVKYSKMEKEGGWKTITPDQKKFVKGNTSPFIAQIKKRLAFTGDFIAKTDTSDVFTDSLEMGVKRFQRRYGMTEDGVIGGTTMREMNQSIQYRIRQIMVNMERLRWAPNVPKTDYVLVNIPSFKLYVYENGKLKFNMNVVVGKAGHNTVIFTGNLKYIVFSPYWNVPSSIVKNEMGGANVKNKPGYLARHNMEIVGHNGGLPVIRQKPGYSNSLGKVKFLFPNSYNIYLHDTPSKGLFNEDSRAFSHGCIRLGEPAKLAEFLLRNDTAWTPDKIQKAMNNGKEQYVTLKETIPVFIGYFTAFVDGEGRINFRDDVYGHDAKLMSMMFK